MGAWNTTFGKATSPLHVIGNATIKIFDNNTTSAIPSYQNVTTIDKGKTLTFHAGSRCAVKGSLLGQGTFKIDFPYVRGDVSTNTSKFEGIYEVASSNCRFVQAMDLSSATLKMDADSYAAGFKAGSGTEQSYTNKVGSLTGSGTLGTGTWNIGYLGTDETFSGVFNSSAVVNKYGTGTLSLSGASSANITINEGAIHANNTSASTTTGTITVKAGALLAGTGQVQNVTVQKDATIGAGKTSAMVGTLTVNGNLTVSSGAKIRVRYRSSSSKTTCDELKVAGRVTLSSPIIEISSVNDTEILDDTELPIFTGDGTVSLTGEVTIIPARPKEGWAWNTDMLISNGILRIVPDPTSINIVSADQIGDAVVYDLQGRRVHNLAHSGTYIVNGKKIFVK